MRSFYTLGLFCLLFAFACTKPAQKTTTATPQTARTTACPEYFYYYQQEKVPLKLKPAYLLAGFQPGLSQEAKTSILKTVPEFENLSTDQSGSAGTFNVVKLRNATSCDRVLQIIKQLQQKNELTFVNPVFDPVSNLGSGYLWVGLTSGFLVTLKSADQMPQLKALLTETRTELLDTLGETTFLIGATKNAKGNALEMANYFHEQPFVENAEPDFFLATKPEDSNLPSR
ncbi:hypothetical protein [Adhaeribacter soli]|uniref:Uncharacterized protein n=1 Tax=Adhaeribacter soli TaxID=2607655 RepID=A0A5N1J535_9BACT|nr:hypothetical protein [Adhaeribacter soli]KAA9340189.1 hypothetical protein F0P94_07525 [Adhaeribacter soli]